ncbi:MAG: carbohydrate-binding family 9-like protein [Armatimonadota bacterium]
MTRNAFGLLLAILCTTAAFAAAPATRLDGAVKLDGVLDEAGWAAAPWQSNFLSASAAAEGAPKPVAVQTRFKVLYDDDALYVGVECDEPNPERIGARYKEHDQDVYQDDCIELFMDPAGEGRYYHHFVINTNGAWYDDYGADYGLVHAKLWDFPLQTGTRIDAEGKKWIAEVRLPFAAMTLRDDVQETWLWNVTRERYAGGSMELSTWSPLKGNFHAPKLFGKLTGVDVDFRRFNWTIGEPQIIVAGDGSGNSKLDMTVKVSNQSPQARKVIVSAAPFGKQAAASAAPIDLAPGASADVILPQFKIKADIKTAAVQINVADADTGAWYKVAVKRLNTEYKPIAVEVLEPIYRQNIYTTQNIPELIFKVSLAPDVADKAAQVVYSLHDAQDKSVREGRAKLAALAQPQKLEVGKLVCGNYTLKLRALDKADGTIVDYATTVRKLPPARGTEVRVDAKRNIMVNGKPTIFIGWYGSVPTEDPRPDVVALQNIQTPVVLTGADPQGIRDAWAKGIYSVVSVEPGRMYHTFKWWQDPNKKGLAEEIKTLSAPSEEFLGYLKQLVAAVKDEPGLMGYYLADEPEINDARSDWMEAMFAVMQELDPYHPLMITNDTLDGIVTHGYRACDILNPDPYSSAWDYTPNFMKRVLEVAPVGKGTMMTPWASSGQAHFTTVYGETPPYSYKVMRHQYLASAAFGCRGWTGYTTPFFMPEPRLRYGLPHIWREIKFLEPGLANTLDKPTVEADAEMASWLGEANGKLYMIVVNHKPGTRNAKISHPRLANVRTLSVVGEGRTVNLDKGVLSEKFEEGDARVYTTDPAGEQLPLQTAVEKEIADIEAAAIKPGNLLHSSLGARPRSSAGYYAPWFTQFYYYAINGITDDMGWHLSHTDQPGWLELALPEEKKIGRVVVYTPNLQDFDLQFTSADGAAVVAEIRGNMQDPVEINLPSQLPTLKLRLTSVAVREGAEPARAQVSEIEAYETAGQGAVTPLKQAAAAAAPAVAYTPPAAEAGDKPILWRDDFANFQPAAQLKWDGKDDQWVLNAANLLTEPKPGGGLTIASQSPQGYAGMNHIIPYSSDYRYFQVKISDIEQKGYRWAVVNFGSTSGKPGYRGGVHTIYPGVYTIDTHYVHDSFKLGEAKNAYLTVSVAGSTKQPDGTVAPGAKHTFDWMQLVRRPTDGLVVTLADGSPLPETLKEGDTLLYRLFVEKPAVDATVEALVGSNYTPIAINGEPYVQLLKTGEKDGREWAAQVTLGKGTSKADGTKGYPVMFRAVITGGAIPASMMNVSVKFE